MLGHLLESFCSTANKATNLLLHKQLVGVNEKLRELGLVILNTPLLLQFCKITEEVLIFRRTIAFGQFMQQ